MSQTLSPFSIPALRRVLDDTFVSALDFHNELPSTNDRALQIAMDLHRETPILVLTANQTAGRGRGANRWWSAPGALTFSLVLDKRRVEVPLERWPQISLTVGLAVCEAVEQLAPGIPVGLKWPNDVYLEGRKLCGILIEVPAQAEGRLVVGVGLNVNNSFHAAPAEIAEAAVSLSDRVGYQYALDEVLVALVRSIGRHLGLLAADDRHLAAAWRDYCVLTGSDVCVSWGDRHEQGRCLGIDREGALRLWTASGERRILTGTVQRLA